MSDEIPNLKELDASRPDYAEKLDEAMRTLFVLSHAAFVDYQKINTEFEKVFSDFLTSEGLPFTKIQGPSFVMGSTDLVSTLFDTQIKKPEQIKKMMGIIEKRKKQVGPLEKRINEITRAREDFGLAILDNTKIEPLNVNSVYSSLYFYLAVPSGVYEMSGVFNCGQKIGRIFICSFGNQLEAVTFTKNKNLDPNSFYNGGFVDQFKKKSEGIETSAYLILNPSQEIPADVVAKYAIKKITKEICEKCPAGKHRRTMRDYGSSIN